jgi:hypothetical protein
LSDFNETIFSTEFQNKSSNFMKIHFLGGELVHAGGQTDGRTDMTQSIVAFRNFSKGKKHTYSVAVGAAACVLIGGKKKNPLFNRK